MQNKYERKLIKEDAKIVVMQNWKAFLLISLPVIILDFVWESQQFYSLDSVLLCVILEFFLTLLYIPSLLCQSEYTLNKIRQDVKSKFSAFHWFANPLDWWKACKMFLLLLWAFVLLTGMLAAIYIVITAGLKLNIGYTFSYAKLIFALVILFGIVLCQIFIMPAMNLLISNPDEKVRYICKKSFKISIKYFKELFYFKCTFIILMIGVWLLKVLATTLVLRCVDGAFLIDLVFALIGCVIFCIASYLDIYMNTSMLSYTDLLIVRTNSEKQ